MRLVSFGPAGEERPGVVSGDEIIDLRSVSRDFPETVRDILARDLLGEVRSLLSQPDSLRAESRHSLGSVRLGPLPREHMLEVLHRFAF